jgi:hypothetical protein
MTAPGRREAARLLLSLDPPAWFLQHATAVADVAGWLARRAEGAGLTVDVESVEAAALLHDVDKLPSESLPVRLRHGEGSAAWLEGRGLGDLAALVRDHPVTRLADNADAARLASAPLEARIVAYADKRAGLQLESMDERFASWRRCYPSGPREVNAAVREQGLAAKAGSGTKAGWSDVVAELVDARARQLEAEVCAAAGVDPRQVRRLRWSRRALREAGR